MDPTSAGGGGFWWWSAVVDVTPLPGVAAGAGAPEEEMLVYSVTLVSPFRIPFRSDAVGVDIRSSVLLITWDATMYDWLVCCIVRGGIFVSERTCTVFFPFFHLFLPAAARAAVASIKAGLVTCITGPAPMHRSISSRMGTGTVPSNSSIQALIAAVAWEIASDGWSILTLWRMV